MARNISTAALQKLAQKTGTEPVTIVEISWRSGTPNSIYGDKAFPGLKIEGRILEVGPVDDAINYNKNGTTQTMTVKISDVDGKIKALFDNNDLHKRPVFIYQWFSGIPYSDRFLIFEGQAASPIVWSEGDRSLSFEIISQIDSREVGFSPEDGEFPFIPHALIGKAWPLVFGTAVKVPTILIDDIPHTGSRGTAGDSMTKGDTGAHDPSLDKKLEDNTLNANFAISLAQLYFIGYLQASFSAHKLGELGDFDDVSTTKSGGTFTGLAKQYLAAGNKMLLEAQQLRLKSSDLKKVLNAQQAFEGSSLDITNGSNYPQGVEMALNIGGMGLTGHFIGDTFFVDSRTHPNADLTSGMVIDPPDTRFGDPVITRDQFFFVPAGEPVLLSDTLSAQFISNPVLPVRYIVSGVIPTNVLALYAWRTVNGLKQLYQIPPTSFSNTVNNANYIRDIAAEDVNGNPIINYYSVWQIDFGAVTATVIYLPQPMSSYDGQGWEDEIWATLQSPVGPNAVDVMIWLIQNYTLYTYDPTSFNMVRNYIDQYPVNFAVFDRPDVTKLLQDIAYQSRCFIWFKNGKFYIKYLSIEDTVVDTITEADIIYSTLQIQSTETEDIVTKYIATWRDDYFHSQENEIILRYNINKYGLTTKTVDYYIYNQQQLVEKSATFWTIRLANDFKILVFKVPISKLNIETLDTIRLDFIKPLVCNTAVNGIVQSAKFDSNDYTIELMVWIPVRFGEMSIYKFSYPSTLSIQDVFPTFDDIQEGNVANTGAKLPSTLPPGAPDSLKNPMSGDAGNGGQIHVTNHPYSWGADPTQQGDSGNTAPQITQRIDSIINAFNRPSGRPPGTNKYQYDTPKVQSQTFQQPQSIPIPGKIISKEDNKTYTVSAYFQGLSNNPTKVEGVEQISIADDDTIAVGTAVVLCRLVWADSKGTTQVQYFMQVPVWQDPAPDTGG